MDEKKYLDYLLKLIRNEKHQIKKLSIGIELLADELADEIESIRLYNRDLSSGIIINYSDLRIHDKLHKLLDTHKELTFKK